MTYQDRFNSDHYSDMTAYQAMKNIEKKERTFRRGDIYLANLGSGAVTQHGTHVQGGVRPVIVLQNNVGNYYAPTLIVVPVTSKVWKKPDQPTHCYIRQTQGLRTDGIALCEQITTIDKRQCLEYLGKLDRQTTDAVRQAADHAIGEDYDIPEEMDAP